MIKKFLISNFKKLFQEHFDKKLILYAKKLSIENYKKKKIKDLSEVEFQVHSQWGEDGIIDWLINKFPEVPKNFLEIGTENYQESNTRFLLVNKNWDGFIIEANKTSVKDIKSISLQGYEPANPFVHSILFLIDVLPILVEKVDTIPLFDVLKSKA